MAVCGHDSQVLAGTEKLIEAVGIQLQDLPAGMAPAKICQLISPQPFPDLRYSCVGCTAMAVRWYPSKPGHHRSEIVLPVNVVLLSHR